MKKMLLLSIFVFLYASNVLAAYIIQIDFYFEYPYTDKSVIGWEVDRMLLSGEVIETSSSDKAEAESINIIVSPEIDTPQQYRMAAKYSDGTKSPYSPLYTFTITNPEEPVEGVTVSINGKNINVSWVELEDVENYAVICTNTDTNVALPTVYTSSPATTIVAEEGNYSVQVYIVNDQNELVSITNFHETEYTYVENVAPPEAPEIKYGTRGVDGSTALQKLIVAAKSENQYTAYFRVNVYSDHLDQDADLVGDITENQIIYQNENFCIDLSLTQYKMVFFSVTAVDQWGQESPVPKKGEILFGNSVGMQWDTPPVTREQLAVNGGELNAYKYYYGKAYTPRSTNWCGDPEAFNKLPFTTQEALDITDTGKVSAPALQLIKATYGWSFLNYKY